MQELHQTLQGYYSRVASSFPTTITPASISQPNVAEDLLFAHLIFKCIVKAAEWTWNRVTHNSYEHLAAWVCFCGSAIDKFAHILLVQVEQLFQASAVQLQTLSELRINLMFALQSAPPNQIGARSVDLLTRHVRLFGKLFRRMQELSHQKFVALPLCGDLVLYYWSKVVQASSAPAEAIAGRNNFLCLWPADFSDLVADNIVPILQIQPTPSSRFASSSRRWCCSRTVSRSGRQSAKTGPRMRTVLPLRLVRWRRV